MNRLAAGIMIAFAALVMNGGLVRDVLAEEAGLSFPIAAAAPKSQTTLASGLRSERVMSLLLTLSALRAAPALLDTPKA